jgi:hypothetical protein
MTTFEKTYRRRHPSSSAEVLWPLLLSVELAYSDLPPFLLQPLHSPARKRTATCFCKKSLSGLGGCSREPDSVARLGGDEFLIVLTAVAKGNRCHSGCKNWPSHAMTWKLRGRIRLHEFGESVQYCTDAELVYAYSAYWKALFTRTSGREKNKKGGEI